MAKQQQEHPNVFSPTEMQKNTWARLRESCARTRAQVTQPSPRIFLYICTPDMIEKRGENIVLPPKIHWKLALKSQRS